MQQTTNYALKKPDGTDVVDISVLNGNMDIIDAELKKRAIDNYAVTTNSGNAYSITLNNVSSLTDGLQIRAKFNVASTGAITLNVNSLGAKSVKDYFGNAVTNVRANLPANLVYESSSDSFILQGKGGGGTVTADKVLTGYTFTNDSGGNISGTMANRGAVIITPGTSNQTIANGYHNGSGYVKGDSNLASANIKSGLSIFGVAGKSSVVDTADATASAVQIRSGQTAYVNGSKVAGTLAVQATAAQTITPTTSNIIKSAGIYDGPITVAGDADLISANIKSGANIFGVSGKSSVVDTSDATATANQILNSQSAYVNGAKIIGTMVSLQTLDLSLSSDAYNFTDSKGSISSQHYVDVPVLQTPKLILVFNPTYNFIDPAIYSDDIIYQTSSLSVACQIISAGSYFSSVIVNGKYRIPIPNFPGTYRCRIFY